MIREFQLTGDETRSFSRHVDILVQNSGCFAFEHYVIGLKAFTRELARSGRLGQIELVPISATHQNKRPGARVLGETNRVMSRYENIAALLAHRPPTSKLKMQSCYARDLMRPFEDRNWIKRYKARKNVLAKIHRIYKLDDWIKENASKMTGVDSYIRGLSQNESLADYPLALRLNNGSDLDDFVQLDGSHRRCVALYNGNHEIQTITVSLAQLISHINEEKAPYFENHLNIFVDLISHIDTNVQVQ